MEETTTTAKTAAEGTKKECVISVRDLHVSFGENKVLKGFDLDLYRGENLMVLGKSGSGKSVLIKCIVRLQVPDSGTIDVLGQNILSLDQDALDRIRVKIGFLFQSSALYDSMTVQENLETGFACLPKSEHRVPDEIFELFPVLKEMKNRRGGDLSGGQQQQLAIGRALIMKPKLLLLDEPTEGIQPNIIQQIGRVIAYLRDQGGMAILLVEQYFDFGYDLADSIYVMKRGRMEVSGAKRNLAKPDLMKVLSV